MHPRCLQCGHSFEREPGYFLGSIYFNYGATAILVTGAYFIGYFLTEIPNSWLLNGLLVFCCAFPLWFFRYARSLWMGMDELFDSRRLGEKRSEAERRQQ
jgi:hypothetical protein